MTLALFDLDNTLLNGDSDHAWGEFLVSKHIVDSETYRRANDYFYEQYKNGGLNIHEYLAFALAPLATHRRSQLDDWHREFMAEYIADMRLHQADELLNHHRQQGHRLVIITATNSFVTRPIATALGVDTLLATEPECIGGQYTGKLSGTPCFQEGKVIRLQQWLDDSGESLDGSYFYSDSHNDLPLLRLVTHPVAVDPDTTLRAEAEAQGWPVISLRS